MDYHTLSLQIKYCNAQYSDLKLFAVSFLVYLFVTEFIKIQLWQHYNRAVQKLQILCGLPRTKKIWTIYLFSL